jgi:hypothetical protein
MSNINPPKQYRYFKKSDNPFVLHDTYTGEDMDLVQTYALLKGIPYSEMLRRVIREYEAAHQLPAASDEEINQQINDYLGVKGGAR